MVSFNAGSRGVVGWHHAVKYVPPRFAASGTVFAYNCVSAPSSCGQKMRGLNTYRKSKPPRLRLLSAAMLVLSTPGWQDVNMMPSDP